ncbi:MAG TPA: thioredoxin domain-containing protein [Halococcus sp.]|nr:thioredoxin domain-containing protein [Halococcus sp.]
MEPNREPSSDSTPAVTRRRALLGMGGVAASALAGCLGFGASGSADATIDANLPCFESNGANSVNQPLPAPKKGDPKSNVTVAAYEDFGCPHCREYTLNVVPKIEKQYIKPGKIRYEHYDFPIPVVKPESFTAANAARAAQVRAGDEAFWVYAEQLFKNQDALGPDLYASIADAMCLKGETVRNAAKNRKYKKTVMGDRTQGLKQGVSATPTVFVNGTALSDHSFDAISSAIESAT